MTKRVYQPKKGKRLRRHGFLKRMSSKNGQDVIKRRIKKGRSKISV